MSEHIVPFSVISEGEKPSKSPDAIVPLPILGKVSELLMDCATTSGVGVISGPSGSGKSISLHRLVARYESLGLPGNAAYYCCQSCVGSSKGIKALLADIGVGGAIISNGHGAPMQLILKIALREFVRKNIRAVLFDETDRWDADAMAGLFAMHDHLRDNGHPIAVLLVTNQDNPNWLAEADAIRSRTLRVMRVNHVSVEEMVGLMAVWADEFLNFAARVDEGDLKAGDVARHLHQCTRGDLRRINYFARIYLRHFAGQAVTMKTVESALERLDQ